MRLLKPCRLPCPGSWRHRASPARADTGSHGYNGMRGAIPGNPDDALTPEQAALVVKQIARFHAHFWNKVDLLQTYYWLAGPVRRLEDYLGTALAVPLMKRGLHRAGKLIPPALQALAVYYAGHRRRAMHFLSNAPQTLVHHDCRVIYSGTNLNLVFLIGNSFVLATGSATSLISWPQLSNRRSGGSMKRIFWQFMFRISRITGSQALIQKLSCRDTALTLLIPSKQ